MKFDFQNRYTELYFTTATVKDWKHLLKPDKYKQVITDSMAFLAFEGSVLYQKRFKMAIFDPLLVWG